MKVRLLRFHLLLLCLLIFTFSGCMNTPEPFTTPTFFSPASATPIFTLTPPRVVTASLPPTATFTPEPPTSTPVPPTATLAPTATETLSNYTVNLYLIALDDGGKAGTEIGCNDSLVPITVNIEPTTAVLRAALEKLLSIKSRTYGSSGLYNSLYQSNLSIESVGVQNGEAVLRLTGELVLSGVCDNSRVKAQLEEIALQFTTVNSVSVILNGEPLDEVLSQKP
jgi:hypothetical protein